MGQRKNLVLVWGALSMALAPAVWALAQQEHQHPAAPKANEAKAQKSEPAKPEDHSAHAGHEAAPAKSEPNPHAGHEAATTPAQHDPSAHADHGAAAAPPEHSDFKDAKEARPWYLRGTGFGVFNHQMAGVCVLFVGLLVLSRDKLARHWPPAKYVWPLLLILPGLYLLVFSDTEWPFGGANLFSLLASDKEVQQHKTYSMILLILGTIEYLRAKGTLKAKWSAFVFPALAVGGSVLLVFHPHGSHEHTPEAMALMDRIQAQHWDFTIVGILIGITKMLWDTGWVRVRYFAYAWPSLMVVLGFLLMRYNE